MLRKRGFTLIELLVVISIIALLIGILLPALGAARRTANQMKNSTQVRGIIQGCILYSQGNSDYYPGISVATGTPLVATAANPAVPSYGAGTVIDRIQALINGNYFTPEYALNPVASGDTTTSYALLRILDTGTTPTLRSSEWKNTTNSTAIVISDRRMANGSGFKSWWTSPSNNTTDWRGSVCWNDNHVTFETSLTVANTKFTGGTTYATDNLFTEESANAYDAFNVYTSATAP